MRPSSIGDNSALSHCFYYLQQKQEALYLSRDSQKHAFSVYIPVVSPYDLSIFYFRNGAEASEQVGVANIHLFSR